MAEIHKISIYQDIEGTEFPAGRRTRVLVGVDSPLQAEHYVVGMSIPAAVCRNMPMRPRKPTSSCPAPVR